MPFHPITTSIMEKNSNPVTLSSGVYLRKDRVLCAEYKSEFGPNFEPAFVITYDNHDKLVLTEPNKIAEAKHEFGLDLAE